MLFHLPEAFTSAFLARFPLIIGDLNQCCTSLSKEKLMKDKGCFRLLTLTFVILLPCFAALAAIFLPTTSARAAAPACLHVVGNQIEDDSNHVIIPHGVDRMGGEYARHLHSHPLRTSWTHPINHDIG